MPPLLSATGLAKRYGSVHALRGVDIEVGEGELVGLLGPNGAGKSTLVKIACGLVRPTSGHAQVLGHPAGTVAARTALGYLPELFRYPGLGERRRGARAAPAVVGISRWERRTP